MIVWGMWFLVAMLNMADAAPAPEPTCATLEGLLRKEIPAVASGMVQVSACAMDPGYRAKIVVRGGDDAVGAVIADDGAHIQRVVKALDGLPIDIVPYEQDPARAAAQALSPVPIVRIYLDEPGHVMDLVVEDDELERAAGPSGRHLQLAATLTGWQMHLYSETRDAVAEGRPLPDSWQARCMLRLEAARVGIAPSLPGLAGITAQVVPRDFTERVGGVRTGTSGPAIVALELLPATEADPLLTATVGPRGGSVRGRTLPDLEPGWHALGEVWPNTAVPGQVWQLGLSAERQAVLASANLTPEQVALVASVLVPTLEACLGN